MKRKVGMWISGWIWLVGAVASGDPGEFDLPDVMPVDSPALAVIREWVETDPEARAVADRLVERAKPYLDDTATPLKVIHYEGLVNTDPRRVKTVKSLRQTGHAGYVLEAWQATGSPRARAALMRWIPAWFTTYEVTGNDVNENKLLPLLVAYEAFRDEFPDGKRKTLDDFVRQLGEAHVRATRKSTHFTNRYGKHVRLAVICGRILDREEWTEEGRRGVKRFVRHALYGDGTSRDLKRRDTLTYHNSALRPPLQIAILSGPERAFELYTWENKRGGSLKKSVEYVVPYALGEKTREEWTNSKIGLDKRRAEAGIAKYQPGSLYNPKHALELMELATYFDGDLVRVVRHLNASDAERFLSWQVMVNEAVREVQNGSERLP